RRMRTGRPLWPAHSLSSRRYCLQWGRMKLRVISVLKPSHSFALSVSNGPCFLSSLRMPLTRMPTIS
ncbi:hypothetical protein BGW80DRAFT_1321417, partial [Lactifluus volemus]